MKTLNKITGSGRLFYPPGWRVYCLGFGMGLVVAAPRLALGQTDDATVSGVAAFFGFTVSLWLVVSLSLFLLAGFAMYLDGLRNRLDRLNVFPMAAMDRNLAGRKRSSITKYLGTIPLYLFPWALSSGAYSTLTGVLYTAGGVDYGPRFIVAVAGGAVAAGCLAAIGIWCIVQERRLKNIRSLSARLASGYVDRQHPIDLATARMSKFLGYLAASPRA